MDAKRPEPESRGERPSMEGDRARLTRLEEHAGFNERAMEQLSAEIAEINKRLQSLGRRVEHLENRVTKMAEKPEDGGEE